LLRVTKNYGVSVKKQKLFERSEFFCFSECSRFLAATNAAAAFFVYFFLLQKKSKSLSGLRTIKAFENAFNS
jgi:hypothetical protein